MERSILTSQVQVDEFEFLANRFHGVLSRETSSQVVSVLEKGHLGVATGTALSDTEDLTQKARQLCPYSREVEYSFPQEGKTKLEPRNHAVTEISKEDIIKMCEAILECSRSHLPELEVDVAADRTHSRRAFSNNHGVEHQGEEHYLEYAIELERATEEDLFSDFHLFDHRLHTVEGWAQLENFLEELKDNLPVVDIEPDVYPALLLAHNMPNFLTGFWQALDSQEIYEKQSPLREQFGKKLFDSRFSLTLDSTRLGTGGFDTEGVLARAVPVIAQGILQEGFYDLEYALKCGTEPTGLATGSLRSRFRTTPLAIPSGEKSKAQLLQEAGRGVIIQHCWEVARTTNLQGDFSCGLEALWFEDGKVQGRVKNMNMSANVFRLFRDGLVELSSEGEDLVNRGIHAPHMLFDGIRFTT